MAKLAIISETGMFHSVARCTYGSMVEWYGFAPVTKSAPLGAGAVHREVRSHLINHLIEFEVQESLLRFAVTTVSAKYRNATYAVLAKDCVSFTADICRRVGLRVPRVNYSPWGLIQILRANPYVALK